MRIQKNSRTALAIAVGLALSGCGGGGGGGGGGLSSTLNPYARSSVPYYTPTNGGSYSVYASASTKSVDQDIFTRDLNRDNIDEVVVAGRMSQPATVAEWQNYNMQIFGWNTGSFSRETGTWFQGTDNQIVGTEPAVRFADFNGDGHMDMFVAPSTDGVKSNTPATVFLNTGTSSFTRTDLNLGNIWSHDGAVSDLNGDGYADLVSTDYSGRIAVAFGSAAGTFTIAQATGGTGASGVSVADYLGNGTKTIVLTDAAATGNQDTKLYSWSTAGGVLTLTEIAALPASRFYLPKWSSQLAVAGMQPSEIRNISMDFNGDGRTDVIVVSTLANTAAGNPTHGYSEVQFLRNDGAGAFTDVTDTVLSGFNTTSYASYQPVIVDLNKDGLSDILLSGADYSGNNNSTRALLQTTDGKFVESYVNVFKDFATQTSGYHGVSPDGQKINVAQGPNGDLYLLTVIQYDSGGEKKSSVYAARITSSGTTSVQATLAAISTAWPYLTSVEANDALARTASSFVNGVPIVDWQQVMNPIGGLGISLGGRSGQRIPIAGSISVPGLDRSLLDNISAVDAIGRDFRVNMSAMGRPVEPLSVSFNHASEPNEYYGSRFITNYVNGKISESFGFSAAGDSNNYTVGMNSRYWGWDSPYTLQIGMTNMQGSPWFQFSGVFGSIRSSFVMEANVSRQWNNGWWAQAGLQQTTTDFESKLVTSITPVWSAYAAAGWRQDGWSMYGGVQPTVLHGSMDLRLPRSVDSDGNMQYQDYRVQIRNQPVTFVGAGKSWASRKHAFGVDAVINSESRYSMRANYKYHF